MASKAGVLGVLFMQVRKKVEVIWGVGRAWGFQGFSGFRASVSRTVSCCRAYSAPTPEDAIRKDDQPEVWEFWSRAFRVEVLLMPATCARQHSLISPPSTCGNQS